MQGSQPEAIGCRNVAPNVSIRSLLEIHADSNVPKVGKQFGSGVELHPMRLQRDRLPEGQEINNWLGVATEPRWAML
jgi:hypothetical protein